jgi:hypothetical protein
VTGESEVDGSRGDRSTPAGPGPGIPEPLGAFVTLFNAGAFWESHEVLEGPWRESRSGFYHGMILFASAFVHVQRRNAHGVGAQFRKARLALQEYAPAYLGIDVDALLARCRGIPDETWSAWDVPELDLAPHRVRGDEIEAR